MTQSPSGATQAAPPSGQPVPQTRAVVGAPAVDPAAVAQRTARLTENVPHTLNRLQLLTVASCVAFGLLAALLQLHTWQAGDAAANHSAQLIRVQDTQSTLYRADALATNAFLHDGLEPQEQRAQYDAAIVHVLEALTDAAQAQPADRAALAALNEHVSAYTNAVTEARANNRQGFPVGSEYLLEASATLRTGAEPVFAALLEANTERAESAMSSAHPWLLLLVAVAVLALLWWANRQLARRFRRHLNRGLLVSAGVIALLGVVTVTYAARVSGSNDDLRDDEFAAAVALASARTAANDAKANESLRVIRRGSGAEHEEAWQEAAATVEEALAARGLADGWPPYDEWRGYVSGHTRVVELDEAGDWERAVDRATDADGHTSNLDAFDEAMRQAIADNGDTVTGRLASNETGLMLALLSLLGGLLAAGAAAWGIGERRREYA